MSSTRMTSLPGVGLTLAAAFTVSSMSHAFTMPSTAVAVLEMVTSSCSLPACAIAGTSASTMTSASTSAKNLLFHHTCSFRSFEFSRGVPTAPHRLCLLLYRPRRRLSPDLFRFFSKFPHIVQISSVFLRRSLTDRCAPGPASCRSAPRAGSADRRRAFPRRPGAAGRWGGTCRNTGSRRRRDPPAACRDPPAPSRRTAALGSSE